MNTPKNNQYIFLLLAALIMPVAALVGIAVYLRAVEHREHCEEQRATAPKLAQLNQQLRERGQAPLTISWEDIPRYSGFVNLPEYETDAERTRYKLHLATSKDDFIPFATYDSATGRWDKDWCEGR